LTFCQWHFPFELSQLVVNRERLIGMIRVGEMGRAYFEQDHFIKKILRALVSRATVSKGDHNGVQYARSADAVTKRAVADGAARFAFRHHDSRPRQRNRGGHQRSDCSWIATRFNEIEATQRVALNARSIGGRQRHKNKLLDVVQSFRGGRTSSVSNAPCRNAFKTRAAQGQPSQTQTSSR
jgi:hypothetical protein